MTAHTSGGDSSDVNSPVIVWIRQDLRLAYNPALDAAVELGKDYPRPIVDLKESRLRALAAFSALSGPAAPV